MQQNTTLDFSVLSHDALVAFAVWCVFDDGQDLEKLPDMLEDMADEEQLEVDTHSFEPLFEMGAIYKREFQRMTWGYGMVTEEKVFVTYRALVALMGRLDASDRELVVDIAQRRVFRARPTDSIFTCLMMRILWPKAQELKIGSRFSDDDRPSVLGDYWRYFIAAARYPSYHASLRKFPQPVLNKVCQNMLSASFETYDRESLRESFAFLASLLHKSTEGWRQYKSWLAFQTLFIDQCQLQQAIAATHVNTRFHWQLRAVDAFLNGNKDLAKDCMITALSKHGINRKCFDSSFENFLMAVIFFDARHHELVHDRLTNYLSETDGIFHSILKSFAIAANSENFEQEKITKRIINVFDSGVYPCDAAVHTISAMLFPQFFGLPKGFVSKRRTYLAEVYEHYPLIAYSLEASIDPKSQITREFREKLGLEPFLPATRLREPWEMVLEQVAQMSQDNQQEGKDNEELANDRVIYGVNPNDYEIEIRVQSRLKNGQWGKGKAIKTSTFIQNLKQYPCTDFDLSVAAYIRENCEVHGWSYYGLEYRQLDKREDLKQFVGHTRLCRYGDPSQSFEILKAPLQMSVLRTKDGFRLETNIDKEIRNDGDDELKIPKDFVIQRTGVNQLTLVDVSDQQASLLRSLSRVQTFPARAEAQLSDFVSTVGKIMPVSSDLAGNSDKLEQVPGQSDITLQIAPRESSQEQFEAIAVVRPLGTDSNLVCRPGEGLSHVSARLQERPVQVVRNMDAEQAALDRLSDTLDFMDDCREENSRWVMNAQQCLSVLEAIHEHPEVATLEWPQGVRYKVTRSALDFGQFHMSVEGVGAWFQVDGSLQVDGKMRLQMSQLLARLRESQGDFIALGEGEYVRLTEDLRKQLSVLERLADHSKKPRISRFNADVISDMQASGANVTTDAAFDELQARMHAADNVVADVPDALQAELRAYQVEGYRWLMRLASWGAGAVLADDMGLGKTVQTIAALLARAELGAALVVVPASVLLNWRDELNRFAPSLKQEIFNMAEDRQAVIDNLAAGTVVITTYGVMAQQIEALSSYNWSTVVLDEAHNIKNQNTKAFKAVTQLKSQFRVLLTGTPLQNRLSEIWALFEFADPGLLGTFNRFHDRFVVPIEFDKDRERQLILRRILSPFILRRTKTDVLDELPPKTETTIQVELSEPEKALYEEIRESALMSLNSGETNPLQAISLLTRLRLAACATELVEPKIKVPSAKTEMLLRLVNDLMESKHRALVFSQFTSHLAVIRRALNKAKIDYLYLDGSMTPTERERLVNKFRNGKMPLFLISLKAGGTGLNLTAADYVIHMDPWWNPAIEDQASDRAYRIGQDRPVTIYRLIAKGTVEERILKLHSTKRSLADALLEGSDMSARLGRDEILELLKLAQDDEQ